MVPIHARHVLSITLPTIAIFLSYLWFKRKRISGRSDPGKSSPPTQSRRVEKTLADELVEAGVEVVEVYTPVGSPNKLFNRSLSGVETSPIDIVIPSKLRSQRTSPVIISDEDLDLQIEKVKLMKSTVEPYSISNKGQQSSSTMKSVKKQSSDNKGKQLPKKGGKKEVVENQAAPVEERQSCERDSANHSPVDAMIASSSLSSISDSQSDGSSDSGKGGSEVASPTSRKSAGDSSSSMPSVHEFLIPQQLVGKLIGRYGSSISDIKTKTNTMIMVRKHPTSNKSKICTIEGTDHNIDRALRLIREKFPIKRFPDITLEHVTIVTDPMEIKSSEQLYLKLVECVNNDTTICSVVAPDHLFVQQPTHPTFPYLQCLNRAMRTCYSAKKRGAPALPTAIPENTVCVAYHNGEWYRAMVLSSDPETNMSYVTFLDAGGYYTIKNKHLKHIRGDMLILPFQAAECQLDNIRPVGGEWSKDALELVKELGNGTLVLTQIAGYTDRGIPLVLMYILLSHQNVVFLNDELVKKGFAEYITNPQSEVIEEEGAVGGVLS